MHLRSGTVVSIMSRASSSSEEGTRERDNKARNEEPVLSPVEQNVENSMTMPRSNVATTSGAIAWPSYGLPPGYTPPQVRSPSFKSN